MKVLQVITGLDAGGAELQLAMLLRRTRHESDVVTLYNPGPVADQIRADGTSVFDLGMRRNTEIGALLKLRKIIRDGQYDVVHAHLFRSQIYARPAAWLAGAPVIVTTEHSIGETHIERRKMTSRVRALYLGSELFSDVTIAVSDVVRERLVRWGVAERKIRVIPNGLDADGLAFRPTDREATRRQFGIPADAYVIGTVGRLDPIKRVGLLIEAAAPLLGNNCKILVVGPGEEEERLRVTAARLGVADHVIFVGYQANTRAMLAGFDLYVAASSQETFGLSVLEALASGLPVLYTACPALDGIQTERARHIDGTVDAMRAEIRKEIETGLKSREPDRSVLERYGAQSTASQIDDLYEQLLATRPPRRRRARSRRARLAASAGVRVSAPRHEGDASELPAARRPGGIRRVIGHRPAGAALQRGVLPMSADSSDTADGRPLRTAIVIARLEGGAGMLALRGAKVLDPEAVNVTIITGSGQHLVADAAAAGFEVIVEPSLRAPIAPASDLLALRHLEQLFRSRNFDVVHTHCAKAGAIGRTAARRARTARVIHTYHGFPFHPFQSKARQHAYVTIERRLGRYTDLALCVGSGVAAEAVRRRLIAPERIRTIGVAVEGAAAAAASMSAACPEARRRARIALGLPLNATVVGAVGRLTYQKAPEDFLAAIQALGRTDVIGVWIGGGDLAERMRRSATCLAGTSIVLAGERADVFDVLPALDVFALPSRYEGLPTAIVEAMICGVPVIATAVNAVPDLVIQGETGLMVPPGCPDLLAAAIRYVLDTPGEARRMADAAHAHIGDRYNEPALREALTSAYALSRCGWPARPVPRASGPALKGAATRAWQRQS